MLEEAIRRSPVHYETAQRNLTLARSGFDGVLPLAALATGFESGIDPVPVPGSEAEIQVYSGGFGPADREAMDPAADVVPVDLDARRP